MIKVFFKMSEKPLQHFGGLSFARCDFEESHTKRHVLMLKTHHQLSKACSAHVEMWKTGLKAVCSLQKV